MKVTFHGVRGSVPTPGPSTVRYGGNTVCTELRLADGTLIILDAGTGIRELGKKLLAEEWRDPIHLLITHSHWDHILGMPFFGPIYRPDTQILFHPFSTKGLAESHRAIVFDGQHFPVRFSDLPAKLDRAPLKRESRIGSARVRRILLNHPGGSDGFRVDDDDGVSLCYLTDNELNPPPPVHTTPAEIAEFAAGAHLIIHDAQYLPSDMPAKRGWGHSLVPEVLELGRAANARAVALYHHEPERDDDALDAIATDAATWAANHAPHLRTIVAREGETIELRG